jgi:hypothetical protein
LHRHTSPSTHLKRSRVVARRARAGMGMIEVIAGVVILALVAGTVLAAISVVLGVQLRHQRTLACAELTNRLILQYLDDPTAMPSDSLPVQYGRDLYRWKLVKTPVELTPAKADNSERTSRTGLSLNRLEAIAVTVWLGEESGGDRVPELSTPAFTMARLIDPIADAQRNPDSTANMLSNEKRRLEFINRFLGTEQGGLMNRGQRQQGSQGGGGSGQSQGGNK